jgi:N-acetylneuraminate synthase
VDIDSGAVAVSPYCTLPHQCDEWFRAFHRAKEMCGGPGTAKRIPSRRETEYLDGLVRGVYAADDLPAGASIDESNVFLAIPLLKGQLSCRELIAGDVLIRPLRRGEALTMECLESPSDDARDVVSRRIADRGMAAF